VKITALDTFVLPPQWLFVRIQTDEGVTGWGEAGVQFRARAVEAAVHDARGYLIGQDPAPIEAHWQTLRRSSFYRGGAILSSALAGIDQALWDIAGKVHGVPVHVLLGGPLRERVRAYVWIAGDDLNELAPEVIIDETMGFVDQGFGAFKLTPAQAFGVESSAYGHAVVSRLEALREAIGPERDIALDVHGRWTKAVARRILPALEPLDLLFVEEPLLPENLHMLRELTQATSLPIATGERLFDRWDFVNVLQSGVAVIQPDVSQAGGISETRRIAAMAEAFDVTVAPHCPLGPLTLACSLQIDFATPNILVQEQSISLFGDEFMQYVGNPEVFAFHDGCFVPPTGPGLGVEIDEERVERMSTIGHDRKQPIFTHFDGSYAEF
jgi:galactonate dehydratase